eukprot:gb/GFBE01039753.1/.p1 GENE.gb/GFBE01039753.1/~~gb/GFBE01039753.1/.p1  ORF type:complete len:378 (+),score=77.86 gb/GFBE01039753.1/:1-1134(+)
MGAVMRPVFPMISLSWVLKFLALGAAWAVQTDDNSDKTVMRREGDVQFSISAAGKASLDVVEEALPYYDLLIMVPAHASADMDRRAAIRRSWAQYMDANGHCKLCEPYPARNRTAKLLFTLATGNETNQVAAEEAKDFRDIVLLTDIPLAADTYRNLSPKIRAGFNHIIHNYRFGLLLKADTDSYVFVDRVLRYAHQNDLFRGPGDNRKGIYGGNFLEGMGAMPVEEPGRKWSELNYRKDTGHSHFPIYAKGAGYFLSPSLVRYMAGGQDAGTQPTASADDDESWTDIPGLTDLSNEDVSVGFWLEPVVHQKLSVPVAPLPHGCRDEVTLVDHHVEPKLMLLRGEQLRQHGEPCGDEAVQKEAELEALRGWMEDKTA